MILDEGLGFRASAWKGSAAAPQSHQHWLRPADLLCRGTAAVVPPGVDNGAQLAFHISMLRPEEANVTQATFALACNHQLHGCAGKLGLPNKQSSPSTFIVTNRHNGNLFCRPVGAKVHDHQSVLLAEIHSLHVGLDDALVHWNSLPCMLVRATG